MITFATPGSLMSIALTTSPREAPPTRRCSSSVIVPRLPSLITLFGMSRVVVIRRPPTVSERIDVRPELTEHVVDELEVTPATRTVGPPGTASVVADTDA